jgi:aspartate/methionine/tyrosine aminotransferase
MRCIPRSGIRRILDAAGREDVISLAAGDPDFATPDHIVREASTALVSGATHYTNGRGLIELRRAWAMKLATENGLAGVNPETQIVVTAGALNALSASLLSVVNTGDNVLVPDPGFANYAAQVLLAGGNPVPVPHPHDRGFTPDLAQLDALAAAATVLILNTPANPTGTVFDHQQLQDIADIAFAHDLIVIADEAYEHLVYGSARHTSIATLPGMAERTLSIHSLSKSWAMTGWRVGFVTGPEDLIDLIAKAQEHLIGCPPAMTQWGAVEAVTGPVDAREEMVRRYARRREMVVDALTGLADVELIAPEGAFYAFPRFDIGVTGFELAERVAGEAGVLAVPGIAFGDEGSAHLRLSYACDDDHLAQGLDRLVRWQATRTRSATQR